MNPLLLLGGAALLYFLSRQRRGPEAPPPAPSPLTPPAPTTAPSAAASSQSAAPPVVRPESAPPSVRPRQPKIFVPEAPGIFIPDRTRGASAGYHVRPDLQESRDVETAIDEICERLGVRARYYKGAIARIWERYDDLLRNYLQQAGRDTGLATRIKNRLQQIFSVSSGAKISQRLAETILYQPDRQHPILKVRPTSGEYPFGHTRTRELLERLGMERSMPRAVWKEEQGKWSLAFAQRWHFVQFWIARSYVLSGGASSEAAAGIALVNAIGVQNDVRDARALYLSIS